MRFHKLDRHSQECAAAAASSTVIPVAKSLFLVKKQTRLPAPATSCKFVSFWLCKPLFTPISNPDLKVQLPQHMLCSVCAARREDSRCTEHRNYQSNFLIKFKSPALISPSTKPLWSVFSIKQPAKTRSQKIKEESLNLAVSHVKVTLVKIEQVVTSPVIPIN